MLLEMGLKGRFKWYNLTVEHGYVCCFNQGESLSDDDDPPPESAKALPQTAVPLALLCRYVVG